jgi:outer membrane protein
MKRILLTTAFLLGSTGLAAAQTAQTTTSVAPGYAAGDIVVRLAFAGVIPLAASSHIDTIGGSVGVNDSVMPEVDLSYFVTDNISVQAIATSTRHEISANNTSLTPLLGNKIDLGSTFVLPPAVVVAWHFLPHDVFDPYVGIGLDVLWPYDTQENQAKLPASLGGAQIVQKLGLSNAVGPVFNVGFDYNVSGPWFINFDYKQVLNTVDARIHTAVGLVKANVDLDPAVISLGVAYRF